MEYIFSHRGRSALESLAKPRKLIALDFDGTLAPIVSQPPRAQMRTSTARELRRLCNTAPVAIISGRSLTDLEPRISAKVAYMIGNHGNEGLPNSPVDALACCKVCERWALQLQQIPELHAEGVITEFKKYTIAVHFRAALDHSSIQKSLTQAFLKLTPPPRMLNDKYVFELIPPGAICKDDAMAVLVKQIQPEVILYVGDDECDELVFLMAQANWVTVRIGYQRQSSAKFYLRHQREMRYLLSFLNFQLERTASNVP